MGETPRQGVICVKGCGYFLPACPQCDTQMVPPVGEPALDEAWERAKRQSGGDTLALKQAGDAMIAALRARVAALEGERLFPSDAAKLADWQQARAMLDEFVQPRGVGGSVETLARMAIKRAEQAEQRAADALRATWTAAAQMAGAWAHGGDNPLDLVNVVLRELETEMRRRAAQAGE